jgi:hypothetical protein
VDDGSVAGKLSLPDIYWYVDVFGVGSSGFIHRIYFRFVTSFKGGYGKASGNIEI